MKTEALFVSSFLLSKRKGRVFLEKSLFIEISIRAPSWHQFTYQVIWKEEISRYFSQKSGWKCEEEELQSSAKLMKTYGVMNNNSSISYTAELDFWCFY